MSEQMLHDDALEQRLRAHFAAEYGQPPAPSAIWEGISALIGVATSEQADVERADWALGDEAGHIAIAPPVVHRDRRSWPLRLLPLVAAALVVAVFATLLLGPLGRSGHGLTGTTSAATATPTSPAQLPANIVSLGKGGWIQGAAFNAVQMVSADEGWAVGYKRMTNLESDALIMHYHQGRWEETSAPVPNAGLSCISMTSTTDGWIGGYLDFTKGLLLHWTGTTWERVEYPGDHPVVAIQMLSAREGWAIQMQNGGPAGPPQSYLMHYLDGVWTVTDKPSGLIVSLAMASPTEGWAAGQQGLILRYHDGHWTSWGQRAPGDISAVAMVSPTDGWMTGIAPGTAPDGQRPPDDQEYQTFMLHFDGKAWQRAALSSIQSSTGPLHNELLGIAMTSAGEGWGVGAYRGAGGVDGMLVHYANGVWQRTNYVADESLTGISMVSADEGWAVGRKRFITDHDEAGLLLHYSHGVWSVYKP